MVAAVASVAVRGSKPALGASRLCSLSLSPRRRHAAASGAARRSSPRPPPFAGESLCFCSREIYDFNTF